MPTHNQKEDMPLKKEDDGSTSGYFDALDDMLDQGLKTLEGDGFAEFDSHVSPSQEKLTWGSYFLASSHLQVPLFGRVFTLEEILGPRNTWVEEDEIEALKIEKLHNANMLFCTTHARVDVPGKGLLHRAGMYPLDEETYNRVRDNGWGFGSEQELIDFLAVVRQSDPQLFDKAD